MKKIVLLFVFQLFTVTIFAQSNTWFWSAFSVEKDISKKIDLGLSQQWRWTNDDVGINKSLTGISISYKVLKFLSIEEEGQYLAYKKTNKSEKFFRLNSNLRLKHKFNRVTASYRFRHNYRSLLDVPEISKESKQALRHRISAKYDIKKSPITPYISNEVFYQLARGKTSLSKNRITAGVEYNLDKLGSVSVYYRMDDGLKADKDEFTNIIGAKYTFKL